MELTIFVVVMLAAMLACVEAWTTCGPCKCYDGDISKWEGLKVAECWSVNTLTSVPDSLPADIQILDIDKGSISKLAESQLKSYRHLQNIKIVTNKIDQIEQGALRYTTNLKIIILWFNQITELPSDFLTYTPNLTEVRLSANKIKRLQRNLFSNLKYLKIVVLRLNEITTIEDHCFANVPQLEEIDLNNNKLISLDINFIDNVNNLKQLSLEENPWHCETSLCGILYTVVSGAMWGIQPIPTCIKPTSRRWSKELQIEVCPCQFTRNPTAALCIKPRQLNHVPTDLPTDLVQLNVTGQQIALLQDSNTIRYTKLEKLYLENNQIQTLEVTVFHQMKNLTTLSIYNNNLSTLTKHQFANLTLLKEIDVSLNNIELIEENCFNNLPSLEKLDLSRNKLQQLSLRIIDNMNKLKSLLLHGNPWRCYESLCGLMDTVVKRALWGTKEVPTCAAPADLHGKPWNRIVDAFLPQIISSTTSVVDGHDLELKCKYCFVSRLSWSFNDVNLPSSFVKVSSDSLTSTLIVKNIHKEQHGYYLCRVRNCEECENDGIYIPVIGKTQSEFDFKQVLHVPGAKSSESCSSHRGLLLLHYTVVRHTELNTMHNDKN